MKRAITLKHLALFLCLFPLSVLAQNEANIWYFGSQAGMDFNGGNPVALTNGVLSTTEGCAAIADGTTGQLLFYTDGVTVWNRNHVVMTNGTGLLGNFSSTQSCIIVPHPGQSNLYYIFTVDDVGGPDGMRYSIVDMNLSAGFGSVTTKNVVLLSQCTEKLTTACHGNGTDYWVITHGWNGNSFYAWQVGTTGLNPTPVISNSGSVHGGSTLNTLGEIEVSPDAARIALCSWYGTINEVFDFNNNTGIVSNPIALTASGEDYGCAFSPDGTKLYYVSCCASPNDIVQFDLSAGNAAAINASRTIIAGGGSTRGHAQLGPDGRIYISRYFMGDLAVINNPNAVGAACNYVEVGFNLAGRSAQLGLPNMVSCLVIVLDLEFLSFTGEMNDKGEVDLFWEAMEERQQGEYVVEKSPDGAYFYPIGEVTFRGRGDEVSQHTYTDRNPLPGTNYYRIGFLNANGETAVSEVVQVKSANTLDAEVTWSPNPADAQVQLELKVQAGAKGAWQVDLYEANGRLVRSKTLGNLGPGTFRWDFSLEGISSGLYYAAVRNAGQTMVKSLLKR